MKLTYQTYNFNGCDYSNPKTIESDDNMGRFVSIIKRLHQGGDHQSVSGCFVQIVWLNQHGTMRPVFRFRQVSGGRQNLSNLICAFREVYGRSPDIFVDPDCYELW